MGTMPTRLEPDDIRHPAMSQACGLWLCRVTGHAALPGTASNETLVPPRTCMGPCLKPGAELAVVRGPVVVALPPAWPQGSAAAMERVTEAGTTCGPELGLQPEGACTCSNTMLDQLAWTTGLDKQAASGWSGGILMQLKEFDGLACPALEEPLDWRSL